MSHFVVNDSQASRESEGEDFNDVIPKVQHQLAITVVLSQGVDMS
jgi:hypothetical protein